MMLREFCLMFLGTLGVIIISGVNLAIPYFVGRIVESKSERNPTVNSFLRIRNSSK